MFKLTTNANGELCVDMGGKLVLPPNTTYDQLVSAITRQVHKAIASGDLEKHIAGRSPTIFLRTSKAFSNLPSEIWAVLEHTTLGARYLVMVDTCLLALLRSDKGNGSIGYLKLLPAQLKNVSEFKDALAEEAETLHCRVVDFVTSANVSVRSNKPVVTMGLAGESSYITLDVKGLGPVYGVGYKET